MQKNAGLLSGVAGILTALAALVAVFMNNGKEQAESADRKSEVAFELVKRELEYTERDLENLRTAFGKQSDLVVQLGSDIAVLKARIEMASRTRAAGAHSSPVTIDEPADTRAAIRSVSAPAPVRREPLPDSLGDVLLD